MPSPLRKRQRMSSPTYDEQVDLSQDDIDAFDQIEHGLSQLHSNAHSQSTQRPQSSSPRIKTASQSMSSTAKEKRRREIAEVLREDYDHATTGKENVHAVKSGGRNDPAYVSPSKDVASLQPRFELDNDSENPFNASNTNTIGDTCTASVPSIYPSFQRASVWLPGAQGSGLGFTSASALTVHSSSSSQSEPQSEFQSRSPSPEIPPEVDYSAWFAPIPTSAFPPTANLFAPASVLPLPLPPRAGLFGPASAFPSNTDVSAGTSVLVDPMKQNTKPFKSPLLNSPSVTPSMTSTGYTSSPLNPNRPHISGFAPASTPHPLAASSLAVNATSTPVRPTSSWPAMGPAGFVTPMRPLQGASPRNAHASTRAMRSTPAKFVTPFKAGMRPGEKGRALLDINAGEGNTSIVQSSQSSSTVEIPTVCGGKGKERWKAFDLSIPRNRQTLASSGLVPQCYDFDDLEAMGINTLELSQITSTTAIYYSFHTSSTTPLSLSSTSASQLPLPTTLLGPTAALSQLLEKGCTLATKPWVDNHWTMVLWKLAGMVCLDPERESDGREKRWCWGEVMRQLLYRYERELNAGSRPPLRKICTQDAPASSPIILCVSNITWSAGGVTDDGIPIEPHPELEVTDGWYRLRAQIDESLARAVRKGILRVGRKIGVAGARLSSERKDPMEILDAYNSTRLVISGNSSHLAPWHAKLGFQTGPYISTLNHLNGDGGVVAVMTIVVVKAYPLAFIEFIEEEDGSKRREGPRSQNDEARVNEKWKARREVEGSKLRAELDKKLNKFEGYADRLERRAGPRFCPGDDDSAPDYIDDLYDELEDASTAGTVIASVTTCEAGWLARCIREKSLRDREAAGEVIEHELQKNFPPREVRNFRVLVVQDAYSNKRSSHRQAQLTVWDALSLSHSEGSKAGSFETGQRFMVTNIMPTQPHAWMSRDEVDSEVYLSSRRDSRWTRLK